MSSSKQQLKSKTRPFSEIWTHFNRKAKDDPDAECRYCSAIVRSRVDRARTHLKHCDGYKKSTQAMSRNHQESQSPNNQSTASSSDFDQCSRSTSSSSNRRIE